jgi:hypothetical protein
MFSFDARTPETLTIDGDVWNMLDITRIQPSGYDWLMQLLHAISVDQRARTMLTF